MSERFVLRNGHCLRSGLRDITIEDGKIIEITNSGHGQGQRIIDCTGLYISSGWIDLHTHAFPEFEPYGDEIDEIGIKQGVTTIVDAGSCGIERIEDLFTSGRKSKTNVFAFLNISRIGLKRIDELSNLAWIDKEKAIQTVEKYNGMIVGFKARMSKSVVGKNDIKPLLLAKELSRSTSLPIMVHIGSGPPTIEEIIPLLDKNDIVTHFLNGKANNLFDSHGNPLQVLTEAIERGIHLDVGHGTASFSFKVAEMAKRHNIIFNTISSDIYRDNRLNGPVFSLANVLSKFLYLGYPIETIIDAITTNAANWLKKPELGRIKIGDTANLTLFAIQDTSITLTDSEGDSRNAYKKIEAKGVVMNGEFIPC